MGSPARVSIGTDSTARTPCCSAPSRKAEYAGEVSTSSSSTVRRSCTARPTDPSPKGTRIGVM